MTVRHYEFIEHTADVAIRAYGATLEEAFAESAHALFDVITDSAPIHKESVNEITVSALDRESLLVRFLSQLIAIHEIDRVVLGHFEAQLIDDSTLKSQFHSEPFSRERHGRGTPVKGISYHMLELHDPTPTSPATVQVLFDI